ncbi:MAG: hypothetical protein Q8K75_01285 [Chlamydiales bacterium]|nr:hypothetical protein [Chlamydiales bacterium]
MLRIQRQAGSREITLVMNKRVAGWASRDMWIALSIALTLHLVPLVLFRFPILKLSYLNTPQTILVDAEPNSGLATTADWIPHGAAQLLPDSLIPSLTLIPRQPQWDLTATAYPMSDIPIQASFGRLENITALAVEMPKVALPKKTQMQLIVSGPAAQQWLKANAPLPSMDTTCPECSLRYEVRVDGRVGKVCWYCLLSEAPQDLALASERALLELRFERDPRKYMTSGTIEVHFAHQYLDDTAI